jgi:hypothetical protein
MHPHQNVIRRPFRKGKPHHPLWRHFSLSPFKARDLLPTGFCRFSKLILRQSGLNPEFFQPISHVTEFHQFGVCHQRQGGEFAS